MPTNIGLADSDGSEESERYFEYVAIWRDRDQSILMREDSYGNFSLPEYNNKSDYLNETYEYCTGLAKFLQCDADFTLLQYKDFELETGVCATLVIAESEPADFPTAPGYQWKRIKDVRNKSEVSAAWNLVQMHLDSILADFSYRSARKMPCPWLQPAYRNRITVWIEELIRISGYNVIQRPKQFRFGYNSIIFVTKTDEGQVFFKAGTSYSREAIHTEKLCRLYPENTQKLIGINKDLNATLTFDFGPSIENLMYNEERSGGQDRYLLARHVLSSWARLQKQSVTSIGELEQIGIPVYDSEWLKGNLNQFLQTLRRNGWVLHEERAKLAALVPVVERMCDLLDNSRVPKSLVHGDFGARNVAQPSGPGSPVIFFDWCSVFIGYPFMDMVGAECEFGSAIPDYIQEWTEFASAEEISGLVECSKMLEYLRIGILNSLEALICDPCEQLFAETVADSVEAFLSYAGNRSELLESF